MIPAAQPEGERASASRKASLMGAWPWLACVLVILATPAPPAIAAAEAAFKCVQGGAVQFSDRPCDEASQGKQPPPAASRAPSDEPAHWRFMSPACRTLAEALRTPPLQGSGSYRALNYERQRTQQAQYSEACSLDEQQARQRVQELTTEQRDRQRAELQIQRAEQERRSRALEQCAEMQRIRDRRRAQFDTMSSGERVDFERFEANFASRCRGFVR